LDFHPFLGSFVTLLAVFDLSAREVTSGPPATELKPEVPHPVFPDEVTADGRLSLPVRSMIQRCVDAFNVLPTVAFQKIDVFVCLGFDFQLCSICSSPSNSRVVD
jgi:hypothetical protein